MTAADSLSIGCLARRSSFGWFGFPNDVGCRLFPIRTKCSLILIVSYHQPPVVVGNEPMTSARPRCSAPETTSPKITASRRRFAAAASGPDPENTPPAPRLGCPRSLYRSCRTRGHVFRLPADAGPTELNVVNFSTPRACDDRETSEPGRSALLSAVELLINDTITAIRRRRGFRHRRRYGDLS